MYITDKSYTSWHNDIICSFLSKSSDNLFKRYVDLSPSKNVKLSSLTPSLILQRAQGGHGPEVMMKRKNEGQVAGSLRVKNRSDPFITPSHNSSTTQTTSNS